MGSPNRYLKNNVPVIFRKGILDIMIFCHIKAQRDLIPSISVAESAKSFMTLNNIDEGELSLDAVTTSYWRLQKEIFNEQKSTDNKA